MFTMASSTKKYHRHRHIPPIPTSFQFSPSIQSPLLPNLKEKKDNAPFYFGEALQNLEFFRINSFCFKQNKMLELEEDEANQPASIFGQEDATIPTINKQPIQFYNGKLRIFSELNFNELDADVLINFCASDILSGDEIFLKVHELAGEKLKNFAAKYQGLGIGNCRISDAFGLKNFKKVAHCVLPRPILSEDQNDLDALVEFDLVLCYRNALDLSMESIGDGATILFTHPLLYADRLGVVKLVIATLSLWMERSPYADKLQQISIACPSEEIAQLYVQTLGELANRSWEEFVLSNSTTLYTFLLELFPVDEDDQQNKFDDDFDQLGPSTSAAAAASLNRPMPSRRMASLKHVELPEYDEAPPEMQMLEAVFEREFAPLEYVEEQQMPFNEGGGGGFPPFTYPKQQRRRNRKQLLPFDENEDPNMMAPYENPNLNQFCVERYGFDEMYIREHPDEVYDMLFRSPDGLQLQLSRNLSATILTIEEEQGGMLRQYRMTTQNREGETLYFRCSRCESLMRYTMDEYRPKITVKDGFIDGDCYPAHHPQCYPVTREWVILQQLDRQARLQMFQQQAEYAQNNQQQQIKTTMEEGKEEDTAENGIAMEAEGNGGGRMGGMMMAEGDGGVAPSGYATVKEYLPGGGAQQQVNLQQEMMMGMGDPNQSNSARNRLRPAVMNESSTIIGGMSQQQMSSSSAIRRRFPISVATTTTTPRYHYNATTQRMTPNNEPILYRRREAPENATLRAIRKCENELEGRSNTAELDRSLLATSTSHHPALAHNVDFWKHPSYAPSSNNAIPTRYLAAPKLEMCPSTSTSQAQFLQPQMNSEFAEELGQEEIIIERMEGEQQIRGNVGASKQQGHSQSQQMTNGMGKGGRPIKQKQPQQQIPGTSGGGEQQQEKEEEEEKRQKSAILNAELQIAGGMATTMMKRDSGEAATNGSGRLQRKFRMIRKRSGKTTGMAFDWREADFGDVGMESLDKTNKEDG